jgi:hypothetical protein
MVKSETIHELYIEVSVCVTNGEEDIFGDEAPSVNQSVLDAANSPSCVGRLSNGFTFGENVCRVKEPKKAIAEF